MAVQPSEGELLQDQPVLQAPGDAFVNHANQLAGGASVSLFGKIAGAGFDVIAEVVLARWLGPASYGLYGLGGAVLQMIGQFTPLGLSNGVIYYGSKYWTKDDRRLKGVILQSFSVPFLFSVLVGILLYVIAPTLARAVFGKPEFAAVLRWIAFTLPFLVGLKIATAATRISKRMKYSVYAQDLALGALGLLLAVVFLQFGWGLPGAMAAVLLSMGVAFVLALVYVWQCFPKVLSRSVKPVFEGRGLWTYSLATLLVIIFGGQLGTTSIGRLFLGAYAPSSEVGIFQAVSQSASYFSLILLGFNDIFAPMIASLYHAREMRRLEDVYRVSTRWGLYLCLPIFLALGFASRDFLTLLFGQKYAGGSQALMILLIGQFFNVGSGAVGYLLIMARRQKEWLAVSAGSVAANILLNWLLVPRWGIVGCAWAASITTSIMFTLAVLLARRLIGVWPYDRRYVKGLVAAAAAILSLVLLRFAGIEPSLARLAVTVVLSTVVFGGLLLALGIEKEGSRVPPQPPGACRTLLRTRIVAHAETFAYPLHRWGRAERQHVVGAHARADR